MNTDKIYAESVVNEYTVKDTAKVVQLKKLDRRAKLPANIFAYVFGIVCALVLGIGMCLSMKVIGDGSVGMTALGICVGLLGIAGVSVNYTFTGVYWKRARQSTLRTSFVLLRKSPTNSKLLHTCK